MQTQPHDPPERFRSVAVRARPDRKNASLPEHEPAAERGRETDMNRSLIIVAIALCCIAAVAQAGDPRDKRPVAVAIDRTLPTTRAVQPVARVLMSTDRRLFIAATVAVTDTGHDATTTLARLRARHNNVYAMAVNTESIPRATTAVKVGGRVFLKSSGGGMHLARYTKTK